MKKSLRRAFICGVVSILIGGCSTSSAHETDGQSFCAATTKFNDSLKIVSDMMGEDPTVDEFKSEFTKLVNAAKSLQSTAPDELSDDTKVLKDAISAFATVMAKFNYDVYAVATSNVAAKELDVVGSEEFTNASNALNRYNNKNCN